MLSNPYFNCETETVAPNKCAMCESKRDRTGTAEGVELPNASPPNPYAIIKFDIGDFVVSHRKIKRLCDPGVNLFETFLYVTRYATPQTSAVTWKTFLSFLYKNI